MNLKFTEQREIRVWVKPSWSVGMAGKVEVLKLPVTYTQTGVFHILEESYSEGM